MNKLIYVVAMMLLLIAASTLSHAQQVKKWVDKDGKVHYGDAMNAPSKSDSVQVTANRSGYSTYIPKASESTVKTATESKKSDGGLDAKLGIPVDAVNQCIAYAKEFARVPLEGVRNQGKASGLIAKISKTCPNVEISCTIKTGSPQDDRCEAMKARSKNMVFSGVVNNVRREYVYGE